MHHDASNKDIERFMMITYHLLDIGEHVAKAGGHDHAAPEAHQAGEDHGHPGVTIALFLAQPA